MQDTFSLLHQNNSFLPPHHLLFPPLSRPRTLNFPILSYKPNTSTTTATTTLLLPPIPPRTPPPPSRLVDPRAEFEQKLLYLESIGFDFVSLVADHREILTAPLSSVKSTVDYMRSMEFTAPELNRIVSMCPELLTYSLSSRIIPVFTFLLREAGVEGSDLKKVINRRPRLLACDVKHQLRPTLYFLNSIGVTEVNKHTSLLSCSVEHKLIPRIEFFENLGFIHRDAVSMFRRFPQLFNYSVGANYEPKLNYFVMEMGRDLREIKEFPQYFSFSLENRIKPRHQICVEKKVCFPLPVLLKTNEVQFGRRLESCCKSCMPFKSTHFFNLDSI